MDVAESSGDDNWTIFIMADNRMHRQNYDCPMTSSVEEIMDRWMDDVNIDGQWVMTSLDGVTQYSDDQGIEDIGESVPGTKIVSVRVKQVITERKYASIFTVDEGKSEKKFVSLDEKLISSITSRGEFKYGNHLASLYSRFRDIGIRDNEVIYKTCVVPILLSDGTTRTIRMPESGTVLELKNRLMEFESGCFSLKFLGRVIDPQEPIRGLLFLGKCVEVFRPTITIRLPDRSVRWSMIAEDLRYGNLVSDLVLKGGLALEDLEHISFRCRGCGRRIWNDEGRFQRIYSDCCRVQSLDLEVEEVVQHEGTISKSNDITKHTQNFHEHLLQSKLKDLRREGSRSMCREIKEKLTEEGLDYNTDIRCWQGFLNRICDLENKIMELMTNLETLQTTNDESENEIYRLLAKYTESMDVTNALKGTIEMRDDDNKKLNHENNILSDKNIRLDEENKKLCEDKKKLDEENKRLDMENKKLCEDKKRLDEKNKRLDGERKTLDEENKSLSSQIKSPQGATGGGQFPPTTTKTASILIHGYANPHEYAKLELPIPVTTVSIREEINKRWPWDPARVLLYRRIGIDKRDGAKCVHICGDSGEWQWGELAKYCDTSGYTVDHRNVNRDWLSDLELLPENLSVSVWGNSVNIITAEFLANPFVSISIHVNNKLSDGNDFVIDLCEVSNEISGRRLQIAISEQLKIDWNELSISMWTGINRTTRKKCFHVCDEDGMFLDGDNEDAEYVDIKDRWCERSDLRNVTCKAIIPNFRVVTDRRIVVVVRRLGDDNSADDEDYFGKW